MIKQTETSALITHGYVDWCTILAGAVVALALSIVFLQFGSGAGFADLDSFRDDVADLTPGKIIMAGTYILIIQVVASLAGGYLAGRMRAPIAGSSDHEREIRDGVHGLAVWATGTLAIFAGTALVAAVAALAAEPASVERAQDIIERERVVSIILAFATGASSIVSAVAAWVAAVRGGYHRDTAVDYSRHISFRK